MDAIDRRTGASRISGLESYEQRESSVKAHIGELLEGMQKIEQGTCPRGRIHGTESFLHAVSGNSRWVFAYVALVGMLCPRPRADHFNATTRSP